MKTLIVDDDPAARTLLSEVLLRSGDEVIACSDAEEAWEVYCRSPQPFVVIDWMLPGMDGLELCRKIKALPEGKQSLILIITGREDPEDYQRALDAGADDYLTKPIALDLLKVRLAIARNRLKEFTRTKLADEARRASEERYRIIAENASDLIWTARIDGMRQYLERPVEEFGDFDCTKASADWQFTYFSPSVRRILGYEPEDALRLRLDQIVAPKSCTTAVRTLLRELHDERVHPDPLRERTMAVELLTKEGGSCWCEARSVFLRDAAGHPVGVLGVSRDISQRKVAEDALRESEEKWRSLATHAPDVIVLADRSGEIRFQNRPFPGERSGHSSSNIYDWVPERYHGRVRRAFEHVFEDGAPDQFETPARGEDGKPAWFASRVGPIERDDRVVGLTLIATDITARRLAENARRKERRLLKQLLELQERDRQLIAYEIHDGLVQQVTASLMHIEAYLVQEQPRGSTTESCSAVCNFCGLRSMRHAA